MSKQLPSDDEIRAALQRSRPSRAFEAIGCVLVLACAAAGAILGLVALEALFGPPGVALDRHAPVRAYLLIPAAGALVGLIAAVLVFQMVRRLANRLVQMNQRFGGKGQNGSAFRSS